MTDQDIAVNSRAQEASWLQNAMNNVGMGNLDLHQQLAKAGFNGFPNNISLWRKAKTQIPDKWIPQLCKILFSENADAEVIRFLKNRHPELANYFNLKSEPGSKGVETVTSTPKRRKKMEIHYIPKNGTHKGVEFVPFVNRAGKFQGGVDRFKKNIEEFDNIDEVINRLNGRDSFKVRMSHPTDSSVAPSLIKKDSLIFK